MPRPKKTDHIVMRNGGLFCMHCGTAYALSFPVSVTMFAATGNAFTKEHRNCPKTWSPPTGDLAKPELERSIQWWQQGERGRSSEAMAKHLHANRQEGHMPADLDGCAHPIDPDDFRRCHLLLEWMPEYRIRLHHMQQLSTPWRNLVDHWEELTRMLLEQMATNRDNGMYKRMKELGC